MIHLKQRFLFCLIITIIYSSVHAEEFVFNGILFKTISDTECETYAYDTPSGQPYSGTITIPSTVSHNGKTYTVVRIGRESFYWSGITKVNIPNSVKEISDAAFCFCHFLETVELGNSVERICEGAFNSCESLRSIKLPDSLREIGETAFVACENITSIVLPDLLTQISSAAFAGTGISSISIPRSISSIGVGAFDGCKNLQKLYIPNTVMNIYGPIAINCNLLNEIVVENGNPYYDSRDSCNAIIETKTNTLIQGCQESKIPASISVIGAHAFDSSAYESIGPIGSGCDLEIPYSVMEIGLGAFYNNRSLQSVTVPSSVVQIDESAFEFSSNLRSVKFEENSQLEKIEGRVFEFTLIEEITIPRHTKSIGIVAFQGCKYLKKLIIESPNVSFGGSAFNGTDIQYLEVKGGVPFDIGTWAFPSTNFKNVHLVVPYKTSAFYKKAECWKDCGTITESNELPINPVIYVEDATVNVGELVTIPVNMINRQDVTGFQFQLELPNGVSFSNDEINSSIELGQRTSYRRHNVEFNGETIICYSTTNKSFVGDDGAILNIKLYIDENTENGLYNIILKNIVVRCCDGTSFESAQMISDLRIKANTYELGDSNGDNSTDVADITNLVANIMGHITPRFYMESADVNKDGIINIVDVAETSSIILGRDNRPLSRRLMATDKTNDGVNVSVEPFAINAGNELFVNINLNNNGTDLSGLQFDLHFPEGIEVQKDFGEYIVDLGSRTNSMRHNIASALLGNGYIRVLIFSQNNDLFDGMEGDVARILIQALPTINTHEAELEISNVIAARVDGTKVESPNCNSQISIIEDPNVNSIPNCFTIRYSDKSTMFNLSAQPVGVNYKGVVINHGKKELRK